MIPTHSLRKSMYIPSSKKELVVLKNECFVSQPLVNPQSRNVNHGHRATLSSIILSKQLLSTQQVSNNLTQISEDTMSNSNESRSKRTVDSSITGRKNPFVANNEYNDNYIGKSRTNHNRRLSCDYNRGVVEFYKSPMKSHKRSYSIESREKKYDKIAGRVRLPRPEFPLYHMLSFLSSDFLKKFFLCKITKFWLIFCAICTKFL